MLNKLWLDLSAFRPNINTIAQTCLWYRYTRNTIHVTRIFMIGTSSTIQKHILVNIQAMSVGL